MPRDSTIESVLVLGAGPIVIGQACEFDYSGTQACRALKEESCRVILVNSNPATIMTDSYSADAVYIEPITVEVVEKVIAYERPDAILATVGGQTALNCLRRLWRQGVLDTYGVCSIGLSLETLEKGEDRQLFREQMEAIGVAMPSAFVVSTQEALSELRSFPYFVRSSFALGGYGSGVARNLQELEALCLPELSKGREVLVEQYLVSWKEYELEVMRDRSGNAIVVCGIENFDPMGVHTGDSITVSPIQTLRDKEYHHMRAQAFAVVKAIGVVSGGCNVQFAVEPSTGCMVCIEVNPRLSRSSALASKATGFPIAKVATKLALGYTLDEVENGVTSFSACFEPSLDYVVTKIPCFAFEKFPQASAELGSSMKSVGETMAIGATFKESLCKAMESLHVGEVEISDDIEQLLKKPHPYRLWYLFEAFRRGMDEEKICLLTGYDPWFIAQIGQIVSQEQRMVSCGLDSEGLTYCKQMGFSDQRLSKLLGCSEERIYAFRKREGIERVYKRVDACSGEFPSQVSCLYSTFGKECESEPSDRSKVLVIGSGANRIGQGIEFDYCATHAVRAIKEMGHEAILVNSNPETVSTDYDVADKLYFEPLTPEAVLAIIRVEQPIGVVVQFGGQTALDLVFALHSCGVSILGTSKESIDRAENRELFRETASVLGVKQPRNEVAASSFDALEKAEKIGFPLIVRPSYIIGGQAIEIIQNAPELERYLTVHKGVYPLLVEEFLEGAMEIDVDAICDGKDVFVCGIIEHLDPVGVHSGDSRAFLFAKSLGERIEQQVIEQTSVLGRALGIIGLFNVQFALLDRQLFVLEVNARASRTVVLLAKTTQLALVEIATKVLLGVSLRGQGISGVAEPKILGLKIPCFPFERLGVTPSLGPCMCSTGEVLCVGKTVEELEQKALQYEGLVCNSEVYNLLN